MHNPTTIQAAGVAPSASAGVTAIGAVSSPCLGSVAPAPVVVMPLSRLLVVRCACGRPYSDAAWAELAQVGDLDSGVPGLVLRLANCICGSTIQRPMRGGEYLSVAVARQIEDEFDKGENHAS